MEVSQFADKTVLEELGLYRISCNQSINQSLFQAEAHRTNKEKRKQRKSDRTDRHTGEYT